MADEFGAPMHQNTTTQNSSTTDTAREQAAGVGQSAAEAGQHVAGVAGEQASNVASEAAAQARNLYQQTTEELRGQAATQQGRLAEQIRSLGSELGSMADQSKSGVAGDLVREVSDRADVVAGWLDQRDPASVLNEVTDFARRRPGTFLAIAAGAGFLAGRLTRGAVSAARNDSSASTSDRTGAPVAGSTGVPVAGYTQPVPAATPYEPVAPVEPYERYDVDPIDPLEPSGAYPGRQAGL